MRRGGSEGGMGGGRWGGSFGRVHREHYSVARWVTHAAVSVSVARRCDRGRVSWGGVAHRLLPLGVWARLSSSPPPTVFSLRGAALRLLWALSAVPGRPLLSLFPPLLRMLLLLGVRWHPLSFLALPPPSTLFPRAALSPFPRLCVLYACSTLLVRLRTGEKRHKRAVRADGSWLPGVFQTRGIGGCGDAEILIPFQPILDDYQAGLFCMSKNGRVRLDGPLYHVAFESDADAAAAGWAHTRGVLRNVTVQPTRNAPGGASLVAAPLNDPARVRVPVRVRGVDRCGGLTEGGGWLNHLTQAVDLRVAPGVAAPLWVTVDVGGLALRGRVTLADIGTEEGVAVVGDPATIVAVISK